MTREEVLVQEAHDNGVDVIEKYSFNSQRLKGLYSDNVIALSKAINTKKEKVCVLAEELGHHFTTSGDIIDLKDIRNRKQELKARAWAYNKQIGLMGIVKCFEYGCTNKTDMAEYLDVTEEFLLEALNYYKSKHGLSVKLDNYIIYFEPSLGVIKMI